MDVRGLTSGHLRVYRGRCSSSTRWFPSAGVIKKFLIYLNGWAGRARGRVEAGKKTTKEQTFYMNVNRPALKVIPLQRET